MPELALEVEDTQQQGRLSAVTEKEDLLMHAQQDQRNLFLLVCGHSSLWASPLSSLSSTYDCFWNQLSAYLNPLLL